MHIVAHAGAIGRREIIAIDREDEAAIHGAPNRPAATTCGSGSCRSPISSSGSHPARIEVTQDDGSMPATRPTRVADHLFRHHLPPGQRAIDRHRGGVFRDHVRHDAIRRTARLKTRSASRSPRPPSPATGSTSPRHSSILSYTSGFAIDSAMSATAAKCTTVSGLCWLQRRRRPARHPGRRPRPADPISPQVVAQPRDREVANHDLAPRPGEALAGQRGSRQTPPHR